MPKTSLFILTAVCLLTLPLQCNAFASTALTAPAKSNNLPPRQQQAPLQPQQAISIEPPEAWEDDTCLVEEEEEEVTTVEHILNEPAFARALEIANIVSSKILFPLSSSILSHGVATTWNDFWAQSSTKNKSNAQHLQEALEELGPVFVKFGQALGSRPDAVPLSLASSLSKLQDCMQPFDATAAQEIAIQELQETNKLTDEDMQELLKCLSEAPIAAASVGQVYKATIPSKGKTVAIKIQRPGIKEVMDRDAALLRTLATWVESIPAPSSFLLNGGGSTTSDRLIASELESAVEGFFDRLAEELDYRNEMENAKTFASLYSHRGGTSEKAHVVVPEFYPELCTENILVMEWLEGDKLTDIDNEDDKEENLAVIKQAIDCTLSQLLDTGVLHADPHGGNLLKIHTRQGPQLGYLDFGLLSSVPQQVRDALVCAVAHLVFDHDSEAVAMLFGELELVPPEVIDDPQELKALTTALNETMDAVLVYPEYVPGKIQFPELEFDKLIGELTKLVPRFKFRLPPYFLQKARAISYLEGMARGLDPDFNVLQMLYPYALNRLMVNPTKSLILDETLQNLLRSPDTGKVEVSKISRLLEDSAHLTGYKKHKVIRDVLKTAGGRRLARKMVSQQVKEAPGRFWRSRRLLRRGGGNV